MSLETWLEYWPSWAGRWFGWLTRSVIGLSGILFGAFLVLLASFGASNLRSAPEWGAEELAFLGSGLAVIGASLWVFARPSKAALLALILSVVGTLLIGASI